jgi:hypothetical protein
LELTLPEHITAFSVSALPAKPVDIQLHMNSAKAGLRRDLTGDRDQARRWRTDPVGLLRMRHRAQLALKGAAK